MQKILILHADIDATWQLADFFANRGDEVFLATNLATDQTRIASLDPEMVVADIHLLDHHSQTILQQIQNRSPQVKFLFTSRFPDPLQEKELEQWHSYTIVRSPFTTNTLQNGLLDLATHTQKKTDTTTSNLPKVRVPIRTKITLPYIFLTFLLILGAVYLGLRLVTVNIQERFTNQLVETGQLASDWMVREEDRMLETIRLIVNTNGVVTSVINDDADLLRTLVIPLAVNTAQESVILLGADGLSVLSLYHPGGALLEEYESAKGEDVYREWSFVARVLAGDSDETGDKFAGISETPNGEFFYTVGPIRNEEGDLLGAILIGKSLHNLVREIRQETLAQVSIYDLDGDLLATTLPQIDTLTLPESPDNLLAKQDESSVIHDFALGSLTYSEILGPLEVRGGEDAGILGSSLSQTFIIQATRDLRWQAFFFATIAFLTIALVGVLLSQWITRPIAQIVNAATAVSQGDFNTTIPIEGDDEITLIAQSFNNMLSGLREGAVYRDLLGRAITPEVRDLLREQLQAGKLRLEGQHALASVVYSDIRGFTTISEESGPARMFAYLNEYLDEVIPAITKESGVVNEFAGDALVAVFGVLPEALSPAESSYHACRAALGMAEAVEKMNDKRRLGGMPAFITGIGVTTGQVVTGAVGSADRLHFSVVGDPVNAAHRLQELNKKFNATGVIISEDTWQALGDKQSEFHIQPLGTIQLRGKETPLATYRLFYA